MGEVGIAASRAGFVAVSPNQTLYDGRSVKTLHVTVALCFNAGGESMPPLLDFPGTKSVLQDWGAMHQRSF
jgi:hypothetical protein